jgi:hypothetical protein
LSRSRSPFGFDTFGGFSLYAWRGCTMHHVPPVCVSPCSWDDSGTAPSHWLRMGS